MKPLRHLAALLLAATLFTACGDGNNLEASEVPAAVMTSFNGKYNNVTDAEWAKREKDGATLYAVEFKANGQEIEALFDANGTVLESKED
ncbi:hypothetical protein SAMN05444008_109147 [Cnuella takakiae]|uniref:Beta-lactamase-inhibitor-like, PepSY-like n=1 Tax=Cnuella takakiae TaxID=1302690 RepID=A0A1M5CNG5_9BACT|nr:hypothetical protein [Cnuella takakiae]SHF56263.1 hypothetical protein SAMN05444008_109147 [Cnuella takakiae]